MWHIWFYQFVHFHSVVVSITFCYERILEEINTFDLSTSDSKSIKATEVHYTSFFHLKEVQCQRENQFIFVSSVAEIDMFILLRFVLESKTFLFWDSNKCLFGIQINVK